MATVVHLPRVPGKPVFGGKGVLVPTIWPSSNSRKSPTGDSQKQPPVKTPESK